MSEILKGAPVAGALDAETARMVERLTAKGIIPRLVIISVGGSVGDEAYARAAVKRCEKLNMAAELLALPADTGQNELLAEIEAVNRREDAQGCLIMRPLPRHIDDRTVRNALLPQKDVDGITDRSLAGVFAGTGLGFAPCTAEACLALLDHYGIDCAGKRAVVVGRSLVIGRPVALLLLARNATVTVCHTKTADLAATCREADILIAAAGRAGTVGADCLSGGQILLDVGVNAAPGGGICGDIDYAAALERAAAVTPVPGGVGSVTTAVLARHLAIAALGQAEL